MALEILIIRLSALGDVVHTLPVAAAIKRYCPDAKTTWVVEPLAAPLLVDNPAVDRVIIFPGKALFKRKPPSTAPCQSQTSSNGSPLGLVLTDAVDAKSNEERTVHQTFGQKLQALTGFWRQLRSTKYDIAIDAQGLLKSALIAYLSGAKTRIGFARTREWADKFLTHKVDVGDYFAHEIHIVDLNLKLALKLFEILRNNVPANWLEAKFPLPTPPADVNERVSSWLSFSKQKGNRPIAVLLPGTTWSSKVWPIGKWEELGKLLLSNNNMRIIICGGKGDFAPNKELEEALLKIDANNVLNLTSRTSLLDLIALYEKAALVVGADSGTMHLAAAVNKAKVLAIFGSTPWKRNGPYGKTGHSIVLNLECQPCFEKNCPLGTLACLNDLNAEKVFQEIISLLEPVS